MKQERNELIARIAYTVLGITTERLLMLGMTDEEITKLIEQQYRVRIEQGDALKKRLRIVIKKMEKQNQTDLFPNIKPYE